MKSVPPSETSRLALPILGQAKVNPITHIVRVYNIIILKLPSSFS